jgi:hypothetical protein
MRIAYFDCTSGLSGDMTLGALVDLGIAMEDLQVGIDSLGLPSCRLRATEVKKKGFRATKIDVEHEPEHAHRHLHHITEMIDQSRLSDAQKNLARRIFTKLAESEAKVHGTTLQKVHFHEVGAVDSIADIVGSAIGLDLLGVDRIACSAIPTGTGHIEIAHGRVAVPAPATAELLKGCPLAECQIEAELTTPTGAAIVATVVDQFGPLPAMRIESIGYGAGTRDLEEQANLVRLLVGEAEQAVGEDQVWILETNLDDVAGEVIGHCTNRLLEAGALDVYTTAIQMKKNRPATKVTVLCDSASTSKMEHILFHETRTLGVRRWVAGRHKLNRRSHAVTTPFGEVEGKLSVLPGGEASFAPEYEACRKIADQHGVAMPDVYQAARNAFERQRLRDDG